MAARRTEFLKLRVSHYHNPKRQRGIALWRFGGVRKNPSLTLRVLIITALFDQFMRRDDHSI